MILSGRMECRSIRTIKWDTGRNFWHCERLKSCSSCVVGSRKHKNAVRRVRHERSVPGDRKYPGMEVENFLIFSFDSSWHNVHHTRYI